MHLNLHTRRFVQSERGASAAEFAIALPIVVLLTVGVIGLGTALASVSALHFATEDAARCASIKTTVCTNQTTTSAYAKTKYVGPKLTGTVFTLTAFSATNLCGNKVVGSGTFTLRTGLAHVSVPLSATACYPTSS